MTPEKATAIALAIQQVSMDTYLLGIANTAGVDASKEKERCIKTMIELNTLLASI